MVHEQLQDVVEALRADHYPELDGVLVAEILTIERLHIDHRGLVLPRLRQTIDAFLAETGGQ
jgi:RecB family endonuclease NucS